MLHVSITIGIFETKKIKYVKFRFDGTMVETAESTVYEHDGINHLASYRGRPMTVGGSYSSAVTEIMHLETGQWRQGPDFPFFSREVPIFFIMNFNLI